MADVDKGAKLNYAIEQSRTARQMAAANLHKCRAELEGHLVTCAAYSMHRKRLQQEISSLGSILSLLCKQEPEIDQITRWASGDPPSSP